MMYLCRVSVHIKKRLYCLEQFYTFPVSTFNVRIRLKRKCILQMVYCPHAFSVASNTSLGYHKCTNVVYNQELFSLYFVKYPPHRKIFQIEVVYFNEFYIYVTYKCFENEAVFRKLITFDLILE